MRPPAQTKADYLLHYTILFLSATLITMAILLFSVALPDITLLLSAVSGAALYLLLFYFARSFRPIPVLITLLPLLLYSVGSWYWYINITAIDKALIWYGLPVGSLSVQLIQHWYGSSKRKYIAIR